MSTTTTTTTQIDLFDLSTTTTTTQIALFDLSAGYLMWIGAAESHTAAIRTHLKDIGLVEGVELVEGIRLYEGISYRFYAVDVTDGQAAALIAWSEPSSNVVDYPKDIPIGFTYSACVRPKRRGRPPLPAGQRQTGRFEVRLTAAQRAKLGRLGGARWLREKIDAALDNGG